MEIAFRARNTDVAESVRCTTREKLTRLARRVGVERAEVCFSEHGNPRIVERQVCSITLFAPRRVLRAESSATEASVAVNRVLGVLERRANRILGRRYWPPMAHPPASPTRHRRGRSGAWSVQSPANRSVTTPTPGGQRGGASRKAAEMATACADIYQMTPEAAALEMLDHGHELWFFIDVETGRPAAVYRRADGEIALCDGALAGVAGSAAAPGSVAVGGSQPAGGRSELRTAT
jgi:ribosome-associated translation inhibitor RaiA